MWDRLAKLQAEQPRRILWVALLLTLMSLPFVAQLGLRGDIVALLPTHAPSVSDMEAIQGRYGRASTLSVVVTGGPIEQIRDFVRALSRDMEKRPPYQVTVVDWTLGDYHDFVMEHRYLYAPLEELKDARALIEERVVYEKMSRNPLYVRLDDEQPPGTEEMLASLEKRDAKANYKKARYPEGLYQHGRQDMIVIFLRTGIKAGDLLGAQKLLGEVRQRADALKASSPGYAQIQVDFGADLMDMLTEVEAIAKQMFLSTLITIALVLGSIFLFFMSRRSIPLLGLSLVAPICMTFAFAQLTVGQLNTSTAFLASIIIGNGVNPNVMWLARYFEVRRAGVPVLEALRTTHQQTWTATATASAAAGLAYASLIITDFRGFRDFGYIGGFGMLACWVGAYTVLPALSAMADGRRPIPPSSEVRGNLYGRALAAVVLGAPRTVLLVTLALTVGAGYYTYRYVADDPMEYDFRNLQSKRDPGSKLAKINREQGTVVEQGSRGSGIVVSLNHINQVDPVQAELERIGRERPQTMGPVRSIRDLVPGHQEQKLEVLTDIRSLLLELRPYADEEQITLIDKHLPQPGLKAFSHGQIPQEVLRNLTERDGTVGRVLYVQEFPGKPGWDGAYMIKWADAVRQVRLPDGSRPPVTGNAAVFADLMTSIYKDGPRAVTAALSVTCLLLLLGFRTMRDRLLTLLGLMLGIVWMAGVLAVGGVKLNFLNFVAFPITFGNGADYSVNFVKRFGEEEARSPSRRQQVRDALEGTGGAVVLSSLTTIFAYVSLYASSNQAINSFGVAMAVSEVTCLATAVLVLPSLLVVLSRQPEARTKPGK